MESEPESPPESPIEPKSSLNHCCPKCERSCYSDPRILSCLHSFCKQCIMDVHDEGTGSIRCPTCEEVTRLSQGDKSLDSLHRNIRLNDEVIRNELFTKLTSSPAPQCDGCDNIAVAYCTEKTCTFKGFMCEACYKSHQKRKKQTESHTVIILKDAQEKTKAELMEVLIKCFPAPSKCIEHKEKELNFHCNRCFKPACSECVTLHHHQHDVCDLSEKIGEVKEDIQKKLQLVKAEHETIGEAISKNKETQSAVNNRGEEIDAIIENTFGQLHDLLHEREQELKDENKRIVDKKIGVLKEQLERLSKFSDASKHCYDLGTEACTDYSEVQLLSIAKPISKRAQNLNEESKTIPLEIRETADMSASIDNAQLASIIKSHGAVEDVTPFSKESLIFIPRRNIGLNAEMNVRILLRDSKGNRISCGGSVVNGKLSRSGARETIECGVQDNSDGTYIVKVASPNQGKHELTVTVNGEPTMNSPFNITIVPIHEYTNIGIPLQKIKVKKPLGVSFSKNGRIFVTSQTDRCVHVYNSRGEEKLKSIGYPFLQNLKGIPYGLDIQQMAGQECETVFVADQASHKFHCFPVEGESVESFCQKGRDVRQILKPVDVKISPEGKVCVSDSGNNRVQVFDLDQRSLHIRSSHVLGDFETEDFVPKGLCFDLKGNLHVTGFSSSKVHVFSLITCERVGLYESKINSPTSIAIDAAGFSIVVGGSAISVIDFSSSGRVMNFAEDIFGSLTGVGVSPNGSVWVVDSANDELVKVAMNFFINVD